MPEATRISFITGHQLILVSVVLNRTKAFRFIVDTGAQRTIISHDVADTLGLDIAHLLRFEAIVTAERQTPPVPIVRLDSVQSPPITFEFDRCTNYAKYQDISPDLQKGAVFS